MSAIVGQAIAYWRVVRREFEDYREAQFARAHDECAGVLLNREARQRGVDPYSLFIGPHARADRWASEELRAWWAVNGRLTFAEYEAQHLDGEMVPVA